MTEISYIFADISNILGYLYYFQISQVYNLSDVCVCVCVRACACACVRVRVVTSSKIRSVGILDTIVCSESLVWLFSPAWDAVKLTLPGCWLHLSFGGH